MYSRKLKVRGQSLGSLLSRLNCKFRSIHGECSSCEGSARRFCSASVFQFQSSCDSIRLSWRYQVRLAHSSRRFYNSDSDGSNASEGRHVPIKDATKFGEVSSQKVDALSESNENNEHKHLGEQDQQEWFNSEILSTESKDSPFLTWKHRFKKEILRRVVPWEKITVSLKTFPYYINEHTMNLLVECASSHLKQRKFALAYGAQLTSSTGKILLQSVPGTELYRERIVRALARDLHVPLLDLDSSIFSQFDFIEEYASRSESETSGEGCLSESEVEEDNAARNEEKWGSSNETKLSGGDDVDGVDDLEEFARTTSGEAESTSDYAESEANLDEPIRLFKMVQDIMHDHDTEAKDWYTAIEALCEVLQSLQPLIVYFPDSLRLLLSSVPKSICEEFICKMEQMFEKLSGPIVLICGQNIIETRSKEKEKLLSAIKQIAKGLSAAKSSKGNDINKLFTNSIVIHLPKEDEQLRVFNKQIEEDKKIIMSRNNFIELLKVLEEHDLSCLELLHLKTDGVILTKQKAEKAIGWARNHYLSTVTLPSISNGRMHIPLESLEVAISRLKEQESVSRNPSQSIKNLAKDEYESNFISAVVPSDEIGVKFDDIGALEDVKRTLNELVTLPMRRPELFSHGNLLRPCRGILLFGPPGTGKTLLAKALATEAGANFINITSSTLTSKWFGDAEKLTKALFSFASRLTPVIIFVDEVDSLLGARGGAFEHEATRRMRNEFMAAWDGLRSKDGQRILILGATNRPFDLDDAVIRRLPRRIYVDLPDAENRMKILKILLSQERLDHGFKLEELANATEGYSGSDLKNLCVAAAYRPIQELLEEEKQLVKKTMSPSLRPLVLEDFINAKSKVGASVAYDAASMNELRKWNEQYGEGGSRRKSSFGFGN